MAPVLAEANARIRKNQSRLIEYRTAGGIALGGILHCRRLTIDSSLGVTFRWTLDASWNPTIICSRRQKLLDDSNIGR